MRRRAAPNRQAAGVSLFPFLAVLLCTMGALIVVLVVIARQAHLQVIAAAAPPDDELAIKRADLEWRIAQLRESREATKKLLAEKQTELSHFEEHSRRLRTQLEELEAARERLSEIAAGDTRDQAKLKSELERLQYRVAGLRGELGKLVEKARQGQESYAIIPYHGPNETYRRPIYIECRATGVILQPAGLVLTEQDFVIDSGPSNPLASALRAAREYYLRNSLKGQGETGSAYPLMIVRPDGVSAYYVAQKAIESWGSEFGYELIAQDWQIEYAPADPMLVLAMKQAISEGRMRQAYLASAAPGLFYNSRQVSFRGAPHGGLAGGGSALGGIRRAHVGGGSGRPASVAGGTRRLPGGGSSSSGAGDNPYLDALAEEGSQNGSGSPGTGAGGGAPGGQQLGPSVAGPGGIGGIGIGGGNAGDPLLASAANSGKGGQGSGFGGQGSGNGRQGARPGGQGLTMPGVRPGGVGQGSGNKLPGAASAGFAANGELSGNGGGLWPTAAGTSAVGGGAASVARGPGAGAAATGGGGNNPTAGFAGGTGNKPAAASRPATMAGNAMATSGNAGNIAQARSALATDGEGAATSGQASGGLSGAYGSQRSAASGVGPDGLNGAGDSPATATGGAASNARSSSVGQLASTTRGGSAAGSSSAGGPSNGSSSRGGSSNGGSASGGNSAAAGAGTPGGGSMGSAMMQPGQMGMPMPTISMGAQPPDPNSSSSRGGKRERNWANPDASTMNVPIERRIRIVCDAEHLTVMPDGRAARGMRIIKLGAHTEDSLDELVSTVWDRIDSWGTAGRGMYWRPKLVMTIEPGGQRRYTELQALLADSGFDVHGRPRTIQRKTR